MVGHLLGVQSRYLDVAARVDDDVAGKHDRDVHEVHGFFLGGKVRVGIRVARLVLQFFVDEFVDVVDEPVGEEEVEEQSEDYAPHQVAQDDVGVREPCGLVDHVDGEIILELGVLFLVQLFS